MKKWFLTVFLVMTAFLLNAQYSPITINPSGNVVNTNANITFTNKLFGIFNGNGSSLTNLSLNNATGTNVTVTNLNMSGVITLTNITISNPTFTGSGSFGGVGMTNASISASNVTAIGTITGNGRGLTNIPASSIVPTNIITWIDVAEFADGWNSYYYRGGASSPAYFTNSAMNEYAFAVNATYVGFGIRVTPQMTYGYTNLNVTVYFVASTTTVKGTLDVIMRYQDLNSSFGATPYVALNVGTFTNGINPRTCTISINPSVTNWFGNLNIATGSGILTNQIHCMGVKLEAY